MSANLPTPSASVTTAPSIHSLPYLNRFQPLAYLLILVTVAAFAYAEPNFAVFIVGFAAVLLSWGLVEGKNGKPLPKLLINLGVLAAAIAFYLEIVAFPEGHDIRRANLLVALGHFMGGILLCKLFEKKTNRDYAQVFTLSFLIMVAGAIVATASLFFAVLLACYLALGLYVLLLFHLRVETQNALAHNLFNIQSAFAGDSPTLLRKDVRYVTAWTAVLLIAIAAAVFLLFPRAAGFRDAGSTSFITGFNEQVRMPDSVFLHPSETVVFEARLEQNGLNLGSETYAPYFRGTVLDVYDPVRREWSRASSKNPASYFEYSLTPGETVRLAADSGPPAAAIVQTYTLRSSTSTSLFAIGPALSFSSTQTPSIFFSRHEMLINLKRPILPFTYTVTSPFGPRIADPAESSFVSPGDLGAPVAGLHSSVPERITALARSIAPELLPPPGEKLNPENIGPIAKKFQEYLRNNYPYTLHFRVQSRSLDPTEDFLFNRKSIGGHCECFASAMVMLCRSVGINARMAAGYSGGEYNSLGGFYLVKEKDAHAWVEVFLPERGWANFDPSPAGRTATLHSSNIARWFQEISQLLQKAWLSTVVAFDNTSRKYILSYVSGFFEWISDWCKAIVFNGIEGLGAILFGDTPLFQKIYAFLDLIAAGFLAGWFFKHVRRRRSSELPRILQKVDRKTQKQLAVELVFFDDLLRILGKTGRRKHPAETPREYVNRIASCLGNAAADARWLIATFYDVRFGTLRVNTSVRERIAISLQNVRRQFHR